LKIVELRFVESTNPNNSHINIKIRLVIHFFLLNK